MLNICLVAIDLPTQRVYFSVIPEKNFLLLYAALKTLARIEYRVMKHAFCEVVTQNGKILRTLHFKTFTTGYEYLDAEKLAVKRFDFHAFTSAH